MGFLFKLCFWLGVAVMIMPPEDRPGQALAGAPQESIEDRFRIAVQSAVVFASEVASTCTTNPKLCEATAALAQTTAATGQALVTEAREAIAEAAAPRPAAAQAIDAPPAPEQDGRVGLFQDPAG
jgi:hypothetical protein